MGSVQATIGSSLGGWQHMLKYSKLSRSASQDVNHLPEGTWHFLSQGRSFSFLSVLRLEV